VLKIKRKGLVKPWKKRLAIRFTRGVAFSAFLIAISLISVGFLYTWVVGKNVKNVEEKIDTTIKNNTIKTAEPADNAPVGIALQSITPRVAQGSKVSLTIRTLKNSDCKILIRNEKKEIINDPTIANKIADEYGMADWSWTMPKSASLGKWFVDINCYRNQKSGYYRADFLVSNNIE